MGSRHCESRSDDVSVSYYLPVSIYKKNNETYPSEQAAATATARTVVQIFNRMLFLGVIIIWEKSNGWEMMCSLDRLRMSTESDRSLQTRRLSSGV